MLVNKKTQALLARSSPVFLHKSLHSFPHLQALSVKSNQTQSDAKQMIQFQRHIAYMQGFEKCNFMQASPHSSRDVPGNFLFTGVRIFWDSEEQSFSLPLSPYAQNSNQQESISTTSTFSSCLWQFYRSLCRSWLWFPEPGTPACYAPLTSLLQWRHHTIRYEMLF